MHFVKLASNNREKKSAQQIREVEYSARQQDLPYITLQALLFEASHLLKYTVSPVLDQPT